MVARDDRRVEIHHTTYALKLDSPVPGLEIRFTCLPGPVPVSNDYKADSLGVGDIANLNVANLMGLVLWVEERPLGTWSAAADTSAATKAGGTPPSHFYVSELKATLDVSALLKQRQDASDPQRNRPELARLDALVAATVECILDNAGHSRPPIRKLRLNVVGWDRFRHYSNLYTVKAAADRRDFGY
jgi:hypothetical protein